ncbi:MAG: peptide chain release factor-like protein [Ilumatobacteraceae bacterium]
MRLTGSGRPRRQSLDPSDLGGVNQVTFVVRGDDAWQHLKFEGGPHRVQRVPVTESQGRVHTSSATVAVLPEVDEVEVSIDERDLQIDVYRSSGAGGQHVNTTDSAVRITHVPSGIVVTMQDERSQLQNRARAMQVLRARLYEQARRERDAELSEERRSQLGGGGRSEKIRTYNFKENRVTDHRIGFTIYRLDDVLAGDLDLVVEPLLHDDGSNSSPTRRHDRDRRRPHLAGVVGVRRRSSAPPTRPAGSARSRRPSTVPTSEAVLDEPVTGRGPPRRDGRPVSGGRAAAVRPGPMGVPALDPGGRRTS